MRKQLKSDKSIQIVDLYHARQHLWDLDLWTVRGANSIIALRCNRISGKFADYWESRAA